MDGGKLKQRPLVMTHRQQATKNVLSGLASATTLGILTLILAMAAAATAQ